MAIKIQDEEFEEENEDIFEGDELSLDDLAGKWLKNPKVGEEIEFTVKRLAKNPNHQVKDSKGKVFSKALSKVDYAIEVHTTKNEIYTVPAWEIFGKMKNIFKKLKTIEGVQFKIKHIKDGMKEKEGDSYEVFAMVNGAYKTLDRKTNEWV